MPIISRVVMRVFFRPIRSPKWPKMTAPTGRAKKATAKVPKKATVPAAAPRAWKKTTGKTRGGGGAVDGEVVELDGGPGETGERDLARGFAARWRLHPGRGSR
jgi:hypothetical protein